MSLKFHGFLAAALGAVLVATPSAQAPKAPAASKPAPPAAQAPTPPNPTFRVRVDLVTNDIVVRDEKGNFVPDLRPEDIEVYEDGSLQTLSSMTVVTCGTTTPAMIARAVTTISTSINVKPRRRRSDRRLCEFVAMA